MQGTSRRHFVRVASGATAGMATWLALGKAPALAQKRELTFLSWNHFVPASDDELRRQAEAFGKQAGVTVRVDTIAHLQLPSKRAAEAQAQSGHDMILTGGADPFLFLVASVIIFIFGPGAVSLDRLIAWLAGRKAEPDSQAEPDGRNASKTFAQQGSHAGALAGQ